jgi:hypothetical protein
MTLRIRSRRTACALLASFGLQCTPIASLAAEAPSSAEVWVAAQGSTASFIPAPVVGPAAATYEPRVVPAGPVRLRATARRALTAPQPSLASLAADVGPASEPTDAVLAAPQLLFVVAALPLSAGDEMLRQRMTSLGFAVTPITAASAISGDATGKQVVVIAQGVTLANLQAKFRASAVPVLVMSQGVLGTNGSGHGMGMVSGTSFGTTASGQTSVAIPSAAASHPLAAGLSGTVAVNLASSPIGWGTPNASATKAATVSGQSSQATVFAYAQGIAMPGLTAPARRAFVFPNNSGPANLNSNGWLLFDTALRWTVSSEACSTESEVYLPVARRWSNRARRRGDHVRTIARGGSDLA